MPNSIRRLLMKSALVGVGLLLATTAHAEKPPLKVGFAISLTGFVGPYDGPNHNAAILRIEEINAAGGLLGRKIKHIVRDARSNVEQAAKAGKELAEEDVNLMLVTGTYDIGAPSALAAEAKKIISFSQSAADPKQGIQGIGPHAFTPAGAAQSDGILMAEWGHKVKGYKTAFILNDLTLEYTKSTCAGFRAGWKRIAGPKSLVGEETFKNRDASVAAQITRIKAAKPKPNVIFICSFPPGAASVIRQIRTAGIDTPIFGGIAMSPDFWFASVPNLSNFYYPAHASLYGDDPRPAVNEFFKRYEKRWGERAPLPYVVMGYSVIQAWERAVKRAGTVQSDKVLAELQKFREESLMAGPYTFTKELHIQLNQPRVMMEVQNGKPRAIGSYRNKWIPPQALLFRIGKYAD